MQINRLFGIVHLLLNKRQVTANELAQHFEVSKRTILRDIDVLSTVGIPLYTTKGKGGGIAILARYTLNKTAISEQEQSDLLSSLQCFSSLLDNKNHQSEPLLTKLGALFGKSQTHWLEVDFANWVDYDQRQRKVEILKRAIIDQQWIEFHYSNLRGESGQRKVCPIRLCFKSQDWYLHGFCQAKADYRFFKLSRINQLVQLTEHFNAAVLPAIPPTDKTVDDPAQQIELTIQFSAVIAYRVYDEFPLNVIKVNHDQSLTVTITITHSDWLLQYLLSFGCYAKVLSPQIVCEQLKQKATEITLLYA
ncbi:helix-turn-helix transcriptional regulator [Orbus mooreae]|uniref:helix-turn-helix transcriptional regulator n=1 Tax=Orbus mooreae TaxID=3074107 RepID=UPI00370D61AF